MTDDLKCQKQSVVEPHHQYVLVPTWVEFKDYSPLISAAFIFIQERKPRRKFLFYCKCEHLLV